MPKRNAAPFVQRHMGGVRYFRRVPKDVQEAIGRKVWLRRFEAGTPWAAIEHEAKRLAASHDSLIRRARAGEVLDHELVATAEAQARQWISEPPAKLYELLQYFAEQGGAAGAADRAFLNAIEHGAQYRPDNTMTVSEAYTRDVEQHGGDRKEESVKSAVDGFIAAVSDKAITAITRSDVSEWLAAMEAKGFAAGTIERRLGAMRAMINRAYLDCEIDARNPFEKHVVKNGGGGADDRLPFNRAMLAKIDSHLATNKRLGHETRNILRLMKATGGGPAEIGGLTLGDVQLDATIPYIWIRTNGIRGLKTAARDRRVPLVGEALDAAKDAVKRATARGEKSSPDETALFASFGINDRGADSISAKLNKAIRKAGVPKSKRLTAYSYRHTMKEALRAAGVVDHVQRRVMGHAGQGVADRYGSRHARLQEAQQALTAAMEHLGDVDDAIYSAKERL